MFVTISAREAKDLKVVEMDKLKGPRVLRTASGEELSVDRRRRPSRCGARRKHKSELRIEFGRRTALGHRARLPPN